MSSGYVEHRDDGYAVTGSAISYITPSDFLAGRSAEIWAARDAKLEAAREARRLRRSGEAA